MGWMVRQNDEPSRRAHTCISHDSNCRRACSARFRQPYGAKRVSEALYSDAAGRWAACCTPVLATWPIHARCHMRIRQVAITRFCTLDSECLDALMRAIRAITDQGIPDVIVGAPAVRTGEALYINALRRTPTTFHLTLGLDR